MHYLARHERQLGRFEVNEKPEKQPNDQNCGCVISERDMGAASYGPVMDRSEIIEASILQTRCMDHQGWLDTVKK